MTRIVLSSFVTVLAFALHCSAAADDAAAQQLAMDVWKASGGENWSKVKEIKFTFNVEQNGQSLAKAQHDWNVAAGTDHVRWKDKDVTVNLASPGTDEDSKAAYGRWVNDSYWLLAPLKLRDNGVTVTTEGPKELNGSSFETLRLSFGKVGLTPNDQYVLYVDPQSKLVRGWDYIPKAETTMHGSWDKYETFGGLQLATEHDFAGKTIRFTDIEVIADK